MGVVYEMRWEVKRLVVRGAVRGAVRRAVSGDAPRCGQRRLAPSMRRCRDRAGHEGRECVYGYAEWVTV